MTDKDYIEKVKRDNFRGWKKIFLLLGISKVRISPNHLTRNYQIRWFNPWNPLAWALFVLLFTVGIFLQGLPTMIEESKDSFKWS